MKPYEDKNCKCWEVEESINKEFPNCDWNMDEACKAWADRSEGLKDNDIEHEPYSDDVYACTCPTCGRTVCGWCV